MLSGLREAKRQTADTRCSDQDKRVYQKDNKALSAWPKPLHLSSTPASFTSSSSSAPTSTVPIYTASGSPFNTARFAADPCNLSCLMVDKYTFPGFSALLWYVKRPDSFFCLHVEQLFAPFYNICYKGSTTWWVVHRDDRGKLDDYLVDRARQWLNGGSEAAQLTEEEREAVKGLLVTKAVMLHPDDLARAGVRLTQVVQPAQDVVVGDGDLVHCGVATPPPPADVGGPASSSRASSSRGVNEAINFLPLQWLTTGLPRFAECESVARCGAGWSRRTWRRLRQQRECADLQLVPDTWLSATMQADLFVWLLSDYVTLHGFLSH